MGLKHRWTSGNSLWNDRKTVKPFKGGGRCYEAPNSSSDAWESPSLNFR
jgi:hypothetical protein